MGVHHRDGRTVITYDGAADAVRLRTFMPRFPTPPPFTRKTPDRWELTLGLPPAARIEYLIEVRQGTKVRSFTDPDNPQVAANPFGSNSVATGPGYRAPHWVDHPAYVAGRIAEIRVTSSHLGGRRHHHLYAPPGTLPATPLPLLAVHDGTDYVNYAGLARCLDALISAGRIRPLRAVLLHPRRRHVEYVGDDDHAAHIVDEVLPHVRRRVAVVEPLGIMGASLGAVAAWHTAWAHPGVFSRLFLQSGTFALAPHPELTDPMYESIHRFVTKARSEELGERVRVFQTCGRYESLIGWNGELAPDLARGAETTRYEVSWAGHDWGAWRDWLEEGLVFLYG